MSTKLNVLEHVMVPDHKIMSEEEVSTLFSTYKITSEHLPKIYHDEPAVKIIGAKWEMWFGPSGPATLPVEPNHTGLS